MKHNALYVPGFKCPSLPLPVNGHMSCTSTDDAAAAADDDDDDDDDDVGGDNTTYTCRLQCNDGYTPFNAPADVTGHVCSPLSNYSWSPLFTDSAGSYLCLSES